MNQAALCTEWLSFFGLKLLKLYSFDIESMVILYVLSPNHHAAVNSV